VLHGNHWRIAAAGAASAAIAFNSRFRSKGWGWLSLRYPRTMRIVAILLSGFIGGLLGGAGQTPSCCRFTINRKTPYCVPSC
jgi:hypothetical protein